MGWEIPYNDSSEKYVSIEKQPICEEFTEQKRLNCGI